MESRQYPAADGKRLRVLFIPQWYPPLRDQGRVSGTFCREHVRAASLFDEVAVLAFSCNDTRWPFLDWKRVSDRGIPTFFASYGRSPVPKTTFPLFHLHLRRSADRVIREWGRPDLIHTQDGFSYPVMKIAQRHQLPYVVSQHWTAFVRRTLSRRQVKQFRAAFKSASEVLPTNIHAESDYRHYGLSPRVRWLPNALDTRIFTPFPSREREPWLLHVSGLTPQKRFPDVVRAFARVAAQNPRAVLQVVGDGLDRPRMEELAESILPPGSYKFHGFLEKGEVAELMRRSRGLVFPSDAETFGCVLMEAMACGCPVLTTNVGGIPAVVQPGDAVFVEVGNLDQIAQGMYLLLDQNHGLDTARISRQTRERFDHRAVGSILHLSHLSAVTDWKPA